MPGKFHTGFSFYKNPRRIGALFLFLCCVFIAIPLISVSQGDENISIFATPLSQHQTTDNEEAVHTTDAQQINIISLRQKQKVAGIRRKIENNFFFTLAGEVKERHPYSSPGSV